MKREVIVARILGMFLVDSLMLSKFHVEHFERLQKELEENGFPGVRVCKHMFSIFLTQDA